MTTPPRDDPAPEPVSDEPGTAPGDATHAHRDRPQGPEEVVFLWGLAVLPLVLALVDVVLVRMLGADLTIGLSVAAGANGAFVVLDWQRIRSRVNRPWWLLLVGLVLIPVYLFWRCRAVGRNQAPLAVWVGALALSVVIDFAAFPAGPEEIDGAALEEEIEQVFLAELGPPRVEVTCPSGEPADPGHTFECEAEDALETAVIDVTVDDAGEMVWRVR